MTDLAEACAASLYVFGFVITGRWAARRDAEKRWYGDTDIMGILAAAALWPLTWLLWGGWLALEWLFGVERAP